VLPDAIDHHPGVPILRASTRTFEWVHDVASAMNVASPGRLGPDGRLVGFCGLGLGPGPLNPALPVLADRGEARGPQQTHLRAKVEPSR
jgi:hypothetical protein